MTEIAALLGIVGLLWLLTNFDDAGDDYYVANPWKEKL